MGLMEIRDYSFSYPESGKESLHHISLEIQEGEFVVLCGKSGCGKSTLLRQLKSVLLPHGKRSGQILYRGIPLEQVGKREQSSEIGFVMQNPDNQIVTDKVWHELAFGLESLGYPTETIRLRVAEMASYFGIQQWFYKDVSELSGGQKQLLNLASIMAMHPSLLILDEPTSQLDPIAASDFLETIRKINRDLGTTILMTEHRLEEVFPYADTVVIMDKGEMIQKGKPVEVGLKLYETHHEMFLAMPTPMQIYAGVVNLQVQNRTNCPITVREGRQWLNQIGVKGKESQKKEPGKKSEKEPPMLKMDQVWFRYEKTSPDVVKGISLEVKSGEFYCLLGGNGTGKSTTMSMLSRVQRPYRGKIYINGKDIRKYSDKELYHNYLGVLPQNPQSLFVKKTVRLDLYEMIGGTKERKSADYDVDLDIEKKEVIENMAKLVHIEELMEQHPYDLSGGEQQRLALAKILLLRPKILLMDEPTKGLDSHFKMEFAGILERLKKHGVTIFMISHDIEFCAEYADRCGLMFDGGIVTENEPKEFFAGNSFYTTSANRMARHLFPDAVTGKDVIECLTS
jgi:energy-coupling factor transport system ATP-binding protein